MAQTTVGTALGYYSGDAGNYNLMTLGGGATLSSYGSTQGGLAIDGNLTIAAGTVNSSQAVSNPTLYVSGSLTLTGTVQVGSGYASLPGENTSQYTWNSSTKVLTSTANGYSVGLQADTGTYATTSPLTTPGPSPSFSTTVAQFTQASSTLAAAANTGTVAVSGGVLTFTSNAPSPAPGTAVIFTLDASQISGSSYQGQSFTTVQITVPTDVDYVVNVINGANTTLFGSAVTMDPVSNDSQLLWNIEGSGTVTLGGNQFYGSILAPSATIVNGDALITGQVVANTFDDSGKALDLASFDSVIVPEPRTCALWGAALCGAAALVRRKLFA